MPTPKKSVAEDTWASIDRALGSKALSRVYIEGPPSIGKSSMAYDIMKNTLKCKDIISIHFNEDITATELSGHWVPDGNKFTRWEGKLVKAASEGLGLVLNEIGRASAAVQDLLLMILDDSVGRRLETPLGQWDISPSLVIVATSNSPFSQLDPALADRFEGVFRVTEPNPKIITALDELVPTLGQMVKKSYSDRSPIMPRRAFALAKLIKAGFQVQEAAEIVVPERATDIAMVLKINQRVKIQKVKDLPEKKAE